MRSAATDPPTHHRAEAGFSLIEILVGAACTLLFVGATLGLATQHNQQRAVDRERALAANAAIDQLETLRNLDVTALPAADGQGFAAPGENGGAGGLAAVPGDADGLPGRITVAVAQSAGAAVLYRVTATVAWTGPAGPRTVTFQTLMGDRR